DGWYQRLEVSPGAHRIVVREPGFTPYVETIRALPGQDVHIKHQMRPGSDVISEQDMVLEREERDDSRHRYDRYRNRDEEYDRDRRRDRDQDRDDRDYQYQRYRKESRSLPRAEAQLAQNGTRAIILEVQPADATVYIDGNDYGTSGATGGELQVLLPEGSHKLEVVRPGFKTFTQELKVEHDSNDRIVVNLEKK
ncbi:MAG TPA: PEGA domain-containing protein, partial [Acidobacteriota bacterium]